MTRTDTRIVGDAPGISLTVTESGEGRPVLVLHGGGGPFTVAGLVAHLAEAHQVIAPTHPGWNGTVRDEAVSSIQSLAEVYSELLRAEDLQGVVVVGSSLGGWLAAEMALDDRAEGRIAALVLIDAVGIEVPEEPMVDFFALDARGVAEHSFADPQKFFVDPSTLPPEQVARQAANMQTMRAVAGYPSMHDSALRGRLAELGLPALVIWGESDRIVTPAYGSAFAAAIPDARLTVLENAGHLPHIEQPEATSAVIAEFLASLPTRVG
ncbi:alpha/beta fold hydrolase [Subtercola frigoramans]|uniref:Pimeloyl-ACP methyl ester carboxylesterase n=1 Tax=Subtercola frigoramans TaxID=120298 RepID=A0ABS2L156_9MICO|nr:alpha/beta fold hydrolase [Subtercola frigoramans]MBM7470818.1 pimeloyl-ACP methyl ester carboxylesterase [Subtercola frigoramans]